MPTVNALLKGNKDKLAQESYRSNQQKEEMILNEKAEDYTWSRKMK